jgi:hypothetical protein
MIDTTAGTRDAIDDSERLSLSFTGRLVHMGKGNAPHVMTRTYTMGSSKRAATIAVSSKGPSWHRNHPVRPVKCPKCCPPFRPTEVESVPLAALGAEGPVGGLWTQHERTISTAPDALRTVQQLGLVVQALGIRLGVHFL